MAKSTILVFVHGYSVSNLDTYGELPVRLREEGKTKGIEIEVKEIFLSKYISFNDNVKLDDISKAIENAVKTQLSHLIKNKKRFICITHSTGAPAVRNWWQLFYSDSKNSCPMSHLIMLAPANFGSALAQLGKGKLSRLKSWFDGVEPGQKILDWLELGSDASWLLNKKWIESDGKQISETGIFPFVITGQTIDRKLYDNLNSYTGETGSDGVIRVASANLNAQYIKLVQPFIKKDKKENLISDEFIVDTHIIAPPTPFRIVSGKSHSGDDKGILKSVKASLSDSNSSETVKAILNCINVNNKKQFDELITTFNSETKHVQEKEKLEISSDLLLFKRTFIHDRYSQVIFKVKDNEGNPIYDYDLVLTAGPESNPNHLPEGFFVDRQKNKLNNETLTYYFNYDVMIGSSEIKNNKGEIVRAKLPGTQTLGIMIIPRPDEGFVKYLPCQIKANKDLLKKVLLPNSTTIIEIEMQRFVSNNVFSLQKVEKMPTKTEGDFKDTTP